MGKLSRRQFVVAGASACLTGLPVGAAAAPAWIDHRQYGPFVVQASFDLRPYQPLLGELSQLELELRRILALRPCRQPINVELTASKSEHRAYLRERFPSTPYRRALFVKQDGRSTVFAYKDSELAVDLRHECTHALLHADLAMVPLWLDEGLAEYFEAPQAKRAFGHPHNKALKWDLRLGVLGRLASLEEKTDLKDMGPSDYRAAWAWTHFMLHGPKAATEQLWGFLRSIRRGEPPGRLSERLSQVFPDADRVLAAHFRQWARLASKQRSEVL